MSKASPDLRSESFDPSQPSIPVSYPIKTLEELQSRSYFQSFHYPFNKASAPLRSPGLPDRPRILVCHDMMGGYLDDKWIQGGSNPDAYAIWHWYLMDVFVYFSHNLVTIPPPCWTNTAHRHGVKVLGTFILENGIAIADILLATKESAHLYAERLCELAVALGFDGWLMNMEVDLAATQIPQMKEFVSHLTQTMHSSNPGSLVIWYDSVTVDGFLDYQNQLNDENKPFFDLCDGIFINYDWMENYPRLSASVAGQRKFDVYMGIDVFGRYITFGQWNTNKALDVIRSADVSAAIFAPGWVYETKQPPDFQTAQNRWWHLVEESWAIAQKYPRIVPFYSDFDQGHGYHVSVDGGQVSNAPWNNLSSQSFQPFLQPPKDSRSSAIKVLIDFKGASYSGGGNLTFKGSLDTGRSFTSTIFEGNLLLEGPPLHLTYSVKSDEGSQLGLLLELNSATNNKTQVLLASRGNPLLTMTELSQESCKVILPSKTWETAKGWIIVDSVISMQGHTLVSISAMCYKLKSKAHQYNAVLGHILVKNPNQSIELPPAASWIIEGEFIKWAADSKGSKNLSLKIAWRLKNGGDATFPKYNVYVERIQKQATDGSIVALGKVQEYLGVAHVETFYVSDLPVSADASHIKFIVQVCSDDGVTQKLDDAPSLVLVVEW